MRVGAGADDQRVRALRRHSLPQQLAVVPVLLLGTALVAILAPTPARSLPLSRARLAPVQLASIANRSPRRQYAARSNSQGLALLARISKAYTHVPAVAVTVHGGGASGFHFTEILRAGVVVAEQFVGASSAGTTMLVAPRGSPTLAKEPQTSCWRILSKADPQTLTDIGHPFLAFHTTTVGAPHATPEGWTVALTQNGTSVVVAISTAMLVRTITLSQAGKHAEEDVNNLSSVPRLFVPQPRC